MFRLVESIRIENKQLQLIDLHNNRFNQSCKRLFGIHRNMNLSDYIQIPAYINDFRYKCRVTTPDGMNLKVEITPYEQRKIESLKLVVMENIDYSIKTDRRELLNNAFEQRGDCDDVLIIKNNCITDSWAANVILFDGEKWVTPDTPLLKGVQREFLLQQKKIECRRITTNELAQYRKIRLINALIDFERAPEITIDRIVR